MATSIEQLKQAKHTWEFTAPSFTNGVELVVELRQPSISTMMFDGTISNPLINDVAKLTGDKSQGKKPTAKEQSSVFKFIESVVKYCMVSPTYQEVEEYADGLTESQLLAIYEEVMRSVQDLSSFHTEPTNT